MKINTITKIILSLIIFSLLCTNFANCAQTISSFRSNYKMMDLGMKSKKSKVALKAQETQPPATTPPAPTPVAAPGAQGTTTEVKTTEELPDIPILHQTWVKYFHYTEGAAVKPKTFFKNEMFGKQTDAQLKAEPDQVKYFLKI